MCIKKEIYFELIFLRYVPSKLKQLRECGNNEASVCSKSKKVHPSKNPETFRLKKRKAYRNELSTTIV